MSNDLGPYRKKELADKLVNIPESEMESFHEERMKNYRWFYIIAVGCGLISIVFLIIGDYWKWIGAGIAIIGFFAVSIGSYKRRKWIRIYQNLLYIKRKREKTLHEKQEKSQNKYSKYDRYK